MIPPAESWMNAFYSYWYFTNPPAALAGRMGCTQN